MKTIFKALFALLFLSGTLCSCQNIKSTPDEQLFIIKLTLDSALKQDPGINTRNFWIDFSKVKYFDHETVIKFLQDNQSFTKINADSLLKNDSVWTQYGYLKQTLIIIKKVEVKGDSIIIELDKIIATDGSEGIEVVLKKEGNTYKVVSSKITWIS